MAFQQVHLTADHSVPLPSGAAGMTLELLGGDSVYYDDTPAVTSDSNVLTSGTVSITDKPVWAKSAGNSDVTVTVKPDPFAVNGAIPVGKSAAYTKTYSTAARTIPNATATAVTKTSSQNATTVASDPTTTQALANALQISYNAAQADIAALITSNTALIADVLALKKLIVALVVDLEAVGIAG